MFKIKSSVVLAAASFAASTNGAGVDLVEYTGMTKFVLNSGQATGNANATADIKLQHSDTSGGTYTDVPNGAFTQVTNAGASHQELMINVDQVKRWVRAVVTLGGTTPAVVAGVSMFGKKQQAS